MARLAHEGVCQVQAMAQGGCAKSAFARFCHTLMAVEERKKGV